MKISTPELCDSHPGSVRIVEPVFKNYGAKTSFGGEVVTIKCFEDNSRVKENAAVSGKGKVMVVDGDGLLLPRATRIPEQPDELLLLRVDADQWDPVLDT